MIIEAVKFLILQNTRPDERDSGSVPRPSRPMCTGYVLWISYFVVFCASKHDGGLFIREDDSLGGAQGAGFFKPMNHGFDNIEFLIAAGPHELLRPLGAVVSGGESARIMLAMKAAPVALAEQGLQGCLLRRM